MRRRSVSWNRNRWHWLLLSKMISYSSFLSIFWWFTKYVENPVKDFIRVARNVIAEYYLLFKNRHRCPSPSQPKTNDPRQKWPNRTSTTMILWRWQNYRNLDHIFESQTEQQLLRGFEDDDRNSDSPYTFLKAKQNNNYYETLKTNSQKRLLGFPSYMKS